MRPPAPQLRFPVRLRCCCFDCPPEVVIGVPGTSVGFGVDPRREGRRSIRSTRQLCVGGDGRETSDTAMGLRPSALLPHTGQPLLCYCSILFATCIGGTVSSDSRRQTKD